MSALRPVTEQERKLWREWPQLHASYAIPRLLDELAAAEARIAELEAALRQEREDHLSILKEFGRA